MSERYKDGMSNDELDLANTETIKDIAKIFFLHEIPPAEVNIILIRMFNIALIKSVAIRGLEGKLELLENVFKGIKANLIFEEGK